MSIEHNELPPRCAWGKPRFGEELHCFFADKKGLFLWFYGPISVMLALNLAGCAVIVKVLWRMRKQKLAIGIEAQDQRAACAEYLKIFVGMGALWVFEILSAFVDAREELWYVTDVVNMLQGVYVFWAQVCTRKVAEMVFGAAAVDTVMAAAMPGSGNRRATFYPTGTSSGAASRTVRTAVSMSHLRATVDNSDASEGGRMMDQQQKSPS